MHAPERPGSSQYHAPSSAFTGHSREREQGSWYGSSCGPSTPAVTLKSCRRVNVNTIPLSDWVALCCGARGNQKAPEGVLPSPSSAPALAVPFPRASAHQQPTRLLAQGEGRRAWAARLFAQVEPHPQ